MFVCVVGEGEEVVCENRCVCVCGWVGVVCVWGGGERGLRGSVFRAGGGGNEDTSQLTPGGPLAPGTRWEHLRKRTLSDTCKQYGNNVHVRG
jgi:hypothetical protein